MFRKIIIRGWIIIFATVAVVGLFLKLLLRVPSSPPFIFIFLFTYALISLVYGVITLYRQGMKRSGE
jgi:hypothetical protein